MKLLLIIILLVSFNSHSQDFIENDPMNIDGALSQKRVSPSERLKKIRQKLEAQNVAMVQKKIEQIRVKHELQLMHKLQASFAIHLNTAGKAIK